MNRWWVGVVVAVAAATFAGAAHAAPPAPSQLTVGDRARPLDVEGAPQFGWMPSGAVQSAYEIRVDGPSGQAWDSGRVASSDESYVPYGGPALAPGTSYTWTVRTWDRDGQASPYAPAA